MLDFDWVLTSIVTAAALAAVWFPLYRGLRLCLEARSATRHFDAAELRRRVEQSAIAADEPLGPLMVRTLMKSLKEGSASGQPRDFIFDATRQYVFNEYDTHYAQRISMYANLLPPIGFIGTTGGLLILFVSMHTSDASLELGALAIALLSSIFALIGFSTLEGLKLRLYGRLLLCLDEVLAMHRRAEERQAKSASTGA